MKYLTNIDLNKNELQNTVIQNLASAPSNPKAGQIYYNTVDKMIYQFDGTEWKSVGKQGTVTSVRVQATSPVQSSTSTAQTTSLNTTISLADAYGDTKNPYGSKTANYVLAAPNGSAGAPSFRALAAADIPDISASYKTVQTAVSDPTASGTSLSFIDTISQNTNGVITPTKKSVPTVSTTSDGVLPAFSSANQSSTKVTGTDYIWDATTGKYSQLPTGATKTGTVTSVTINATSPVAVSSSSAITTTGTRTISLSDAYGDTKNPYDTKDANKVLAGPASGSAAAPTFRALVAGDIPDISGTYLALAGGTMTGALNMSSHKITSVTDPTSDQDAATKKYVDTAISGLPSPMVFKGTVGTGGTIEWSALPTAASTNEGYTYKVITQHTSAPICEVGDTIVSDGTSWIVIPSGDEPSGTVTNVATGSGLTGGPITTTGTISLATAYGDTVNPYGSKTANYILAAPNGSAGTPSFRAMVAADLPSAYGDSKNPYGKKSPHYVLAGPSSGSTTAVPSFRALVAADIPDISGTYVTLTGAQTITGAKTFDGVSINGVAYVAGGSGVSLTDNILSPGTSNEVNIQLSSTSNPNDLGLTFTNINTASTTNTIKLSNITDPVANQDAATKYYVDTAVSAAIGGAVYKSIFTNSALTASGGAWTWTINTTFSDGDLIISVYEISTGAIVYPDISTNSSGVITITINDTAGAGTLAASTYKAVVLGGAAYQPATGGNF